MKVVTNTTPLISLAVVNKIELLQQLFESIYIPQAVYNEIKAKQGAAYQDIDQKWIKVKTIQHTHYLELLCNDLDKGEAEAICLAKEIQAEILIIDERMGYKIAQSQGLVVVGTLTILLMAKKAHLLDAVKPLLDDMIATGRWYSPTVYNDFLRKIGEL